METVKISKDKLGMVLSDVEKLITDFERLVEDQDEIVKNRLNDIKSGMKGKSERELDKYLEKRGVKIVDN